MMACLPLSSVTDDDNVNHWEMVLKFLFECCNPDAPQMYEVALNIIRWVSLQCRYLCVLCELLTLVCDKENDKENGNSPLYELAKLLEPLCCKAFSGNATPRQQHWAHSVQKSPSNHSFVIGQQLPNSCDVKLLFH